MPLPWCSELREVEDSLEIVKDRDQSIVHWLDLLQVTMKGRGRLRSEALFKLSLRGFLKQIILPLHLHPLPPSHTNILI